MIELLNADNSVDGILVQLPLPDHIDRWRMLEAIAPEGCGRLSSLQCQKTGSRSTSSRPLHSAWGVVHLIKAVVNDLSGLDVVVIGRSNIVGKPWQFFSAMPDVP